ncbi:DNA polymerase alpha subunit B isoform X1 [Pantherophis guttatus]|uniref:DNA polymerase alpha subunit B n=1 Tax=Pantherophis guttatus TaxID=94885 RepID=A0ABM3ZPQ2_PANGU|nr:DNA polymerase alpha subunit B isoform X1 [Pantherophis guttatus]
MMGSAGIMDAVVADLKVFGLDFAEEEDQDAIAEKLEEICMTGWVSKSELGNELVAFAMRKEVLLLTLENLLAFEHEMVSKKTTKPSRKKEDRWSSMGDIGSVQESMEVDQEEEELLDTYASPSKCTQKRAITTPENPCSKRTLSGRSPRLNFSPNSFSPSATPSQKYATRKNRGEVVASFGSAPGGERARSAPSVQVYDTPHSLTKPYKFMFQDLMDNRDVLFYKIEELGEALKAHYKIDEFSSVMVPAQDTVTVLGQIGCDSNGKLNPQSVILEGDREHSSGAFIPVDISELTDYSLFPGQVVVMEGMNSTGKKLIASKLYEGVPLPFQKPTEAATDPEPRLVLVACGPYTTSDSIAYEPMVDLIETINKDKPDVCILLGPFVDSKHKQVEEGQLIMLNEEVFKRCLKTIIEGTRSACSHLVIVPSLRDVHHFCVYPQPPFVYELAKEDRQRVLFVSDPCTLEIDGVIFGLTSVDLLFHMGAEEISRSSSLQDRFSRILKHILTQRSYYPLYPPPEDMSVDYERFFPHASLPVTPDVLITPSDLKYFVKDILGCVCINPSRLTKGQVGGSYAQLWVRPHVTGEQRKSPCIAAQVIKI